jgi:hypothetical protein
MDNYYTSQKLFRELKNRGIGSLGTVRHNRVKLLFYIPARLGSQSKIWCQSIFSKSTISRITPITWTSLPIAYCSTSKAPPTKRWLCSQPSSIIPKTPSTYGTYPKMSSTPPTQTSLIWCTFTISTVVASTVVMLLSPITERNSFEKNGGRVYSIGSLRLQS